jgi:hypothetical protein
MKITEVLHGAKECKKSIINKYWISIFDGQGLMEDQDINKFLYGDGTLEFALIW